LRTAASVAGIVSKVATACRSRKRWSQSASVYFVAHGRPAHRVKYLTLGTHRTNIGDSRLKVFFYLGVALLIVFELANVYFIMPLPYSQRVRSIDVAYFLYTWRWALRVCFVGAIAAGLPDAWRSLRRFKLLVPAALVIAAAVTFAINFTMQADQIFIAPKSLVMRPAAHNAVEPGRLVVGVDIGGDARAYPVQFIGYHHQVSDSVAGRPILVSFCTVCRTGRVFSPVIDGKRETFRLVGMDHFNAMFEDASTKSWWRQATGEAVAGPRKGIALKEIASRQTTLAEWLALHPQSLIMQADSALRAKYSTSFDYETGLSRKSLTGTDTASWHDKSWVVGITSNGASKAYDWNRLRRERVVNDEIGGKPVVLALASDSMSFFAFERPDTSMRFTLVADSLVAGGQRFAFSGQGTQRNLIPVYASQEFWHSWRTFHPQTTRY
jgi:hypothetical protein